MTAGVYKIDAADGKCYIGSSINVEKRLRGHRYRLNSGKHKNRLLRAAWRKSDGCLNFSLLIVCSVENLLLYEQLAIDAFKPALPGSIAKQRETCARKRLEMTDKETS